MKRDYTLTDDTLNIHCHYQKLRANQTVDFVKQAKQKYCTNFDLKLGIWEAMMKLDKFIDESDPDLIGVSNIHHAFQTAEKMRKDGQPDWFQLVGLIHDLGKVLFLKGCDQDGTSVNEQWAVGGDTFIVGCELPDSLVLSQYNSLNPDSKNEKYNTKFGMYVPNCGFDNCHFSFGHDEYLYQVLIHNKNNNNIPIRLPEEAYYIIRYHSFYPWHDKNSYQHLANENDESMKDLVKNFNKYDLYTKEYKLINVDELKPYYQSLIEKYIGSDYLYF